MRWSQIGAFSKIFSELAAGDGIPDQLQIVAMHLKAYRSQPAKKRDVPHRIGQTKGGLNSKLHAVCDEAGLPIVILLSEGQMSDHKGARLAVESLPNGKHLLADRRYDSYWFQEKLLNKGITPCIPPSRSRNMNTTTHPINSATKLRTCLENS